MHKSKMIVSNYDTESGKKYSFKSDENKRKMPLYLHQMP